MNENLKAYAKGGVIGLIKKKRQDKEKASAASAKGRKLEKRATAAPAEKTSGSAIASLVLGILSIFLGWIPILGWAFPILAIALGISALVKIKNEGLDGKGMAIAGIITGCVGLAIALVVVIAIPKAHPSEQGGTPSTASKSETVAKAAPADPDNHWIYIGELESSQIKYTYTCKDGSKVVSPSSCSENPIKSAAGTKYGLVVSGWSGDDLHYRWFKDVTLWMHDVFKYNLSYPEQNVYYLLDRDSAESVDGLSTKQNIINVVRDIARRANPEDQVTLFFVGHGGSDHYAASDQALPDVDLAKEVDNIRAGRIIIVMTPCNSGGFVEHLSKKGRIVVTSTKRDESNAIEFGERMVEAFESGKSVADAYLYTTNWIQSEYKKKNKQLTEHTQLDDNGDGVGHYGSLPSGGDGEIAARTYLQK